MQADSGEIRGMEAWKEILNAQEMQKLIPLEEGEKVEIKGCLFQVKYIHLHPKNTILLQMLPKNKEVVL